jgi:Transposase, Mutator family
VAGSIVGRLNDCKCWWHKIGNVLKALPKSALPGARKALAEIWNAEDKDHAQAAANVFAADYGAKWPKAAANAPHSSRWSVPARYSRTASSSNDPTNQRAGDQQVA